MKAAKETVVAIEYTLKDDQGNVIDASGDRGPMEYLHGAQNIIPGLEQQIEGLVAGESRSVTVPPELGYGVFNERMIQRVPISAFGGHQVQVGMRFFVNNDPAPSEPNPERRSNVIPVVVREVTTEEVVVDGNHELAGKTLHFDIKVVSVRAAELSEVAHGHPHSSGGCCGGRGCGSEEGSEGGCCGGGSCSEESEPKSEGGCGSGGCGCSH